MKIVTVAFLVVFFVALVFLIIFVFDFTGFSILSSPSEFSIDSGMRVEADEFDGDTTDFLRMTDEELQDVEDMTLESQSYGKVVFSESINLTENAVDNVTDLDSYVEISDNFIGIDTTVLTALDKPATLYLYGLNFDNPKILRNGVECSVCDVVEYSSGILEFTTTSFSNYTAEETPGSNGGNGGGSGSGGSSNVDNFDFSADKDLIRVALVEGEHYREVITIENIGDDVLELSLDLGGLERFVVVDANNFSLASGEKRELKFDFFAEIGEEPGIYTETILIRDLENKLEKRVNVIIQIQSKNPLFDISTEVVYDDFRPGEEVEAEIVIKNFGDLRNIDVLLETGIMDFHDNQLAGQKESLAIEDELVLVRDLRLPDDALPGQHLFYSKVTYENISAVSDDIFEVLETRSLFTRYPVYLLLAITIFAILFSIFKRHKKVER